MSVGRCDVYAIWNCILSRKGGGGGKEEGKRVDRYILLLVLVLDTVRLKERIGFVDR